MTTRPTTIQSIIVSNVVDAARFIAELAALAAAGAALLIWLA